jgi:hypothetical protein
MTNGKDRPKKDKPTRQCYDILQPLYVGRDIISRKKESPARSHADIQEVIYAGKVKFSGVMDDLAIGVPGSW